jgi:Mg2+-importing ATPase
VPEVGVAGAFWRLDRASALATLASGEHGLSTEEAARRLEQYGPNTMVEGRGPSLILEFLRRFRNPLLLLLLAAGGVSAATGDRRSLVVITCIVLLSVVLDFVQERRAGEAAARLRHATLVRATVMRDGQPREVPTPEVVPGDVAVLAAGDLVPGDGLLLEARDLFVNQAALTGESFPVEKQAGPSQADSAADSSGAVLMGSSVVSGCGRLLVVRTGKETSLGQVGAALSRQPPPTAFELGTRAFGLLILRLTLLLVLLVLLINGLRGRPLLESFLFAVALAVGLTPEMLPMVVSVTLSRGALRLSRRKVLVKRLAAIHDLGSMDVLCTDKTGTLTEAHISLEKHIDPGGQDSARVLELAFLNSHFESGLKSPLDEAILAHHEVSVSGWEKLDEVPFDFERRRVSVLVRRGQEAPILVVKGACEDILQHSAFVEEAGGAVPLDDAGRSRLAARLDTLGRDGFRVLGIAWRPPGDGGPPRASDESGLTFAGFAAFLDPPRADAREAVGALAELGVEVKVVTGDSELVAEHVCGLIDLPVKRLLTGAQIQAMDDPALEAVVEQTSLFCRVSPAQKNRVILALKRRGRTVGYLGDGINDAPPLHSADVGISVEGAVDVARDAADLILLERGLTVLRDAVIEGRRTLGNIIKYILMGTSSNFGNMFSMAGAAALLPFLPMLPIQVLVNNFLYDLSEVPIPLDEVDAEYVRRPHRWDMGFVRRFMLAIGPVSSLFDFATFFLLLHLFGPDEPLFHTGWFVESLATQVLVIFVIRTRGNPLRSRPSRVLAITALAVVLLGAALPYTALGAALGLAPLPGRFFLVLLVLVPAYLLAVEAVKRLFYARFSGLEAGRARVKQV